MVCNHEWVYAPFLDMKSSVSPYASIQRVCNSCGTKDSIKADTSKPGSSEYYKVLRRFAETNSTKEVLAQGKKTFEKLDTPLPAAKNLSGRPVKAVVPPVTAPVAAPTKLKAQKDDEADDEGDDNEEESPGML